MQRKINKKVKTKQIKMMKEITPYGFLFYSFTLTFMIV